VAGKDELFIKNDAILFALL